MTAPNPIPTPARAARRGDEHPVGVRVQMPQEMRNAIDATGQKRSTFLREAAREKLARIDAD